jgi:uroporphyrinogen III methyltransferase/synthase
MAATHIAESLAETLGDVAGHRVLWPRASTTRDVLGTILRARGAQVDEVVVYRTVAAILPTDATERVRDADVATFASPSAVHQFVTHFGPAAAKQVVCIGPVTAAAAQAAGMQVYAVATSYTADGLVSALSH